MKVIKVYNVAGKEFSNKQDALNYENELRNNLELRARNLKVFYWDMLGYPGEIIAIQLINHFCHYHRFDFGRYRNRYVGEIIMKDIQYVKWYIKNIPMFKLNKEEKVLLNTSWKRSIGGYKTDFLDTWETSGDEYDIKLINWEQEMMAQEKILNKKLI